MPRTKLDKYSRKQNSEFVELIWGRLASEEISIDELAERTGISRNILYARKKKPEEFRVWEVAKICRNLNIPIEETRCCFRY